MDLNFSDFVDFLNIALKIQKQRAKAKNVEKHSKEYEKFKDYEKNIGGIVAKACNQSSANHTCFDKDSKNNFKPH